MFSAKCANVPVSRCVKRDKKKIDWKHKNSNLNIATNHMDCLFLLQLIWIEFVGGTSNMQSKLSNIYWNELTNCHRNKTLFVFPNRKTVWLIFMFICMVTARDKNAFRNVKWCIDRHTYTIPFQRYHVYLDLCSLELVDATILHSSTISNAVNSLVSCVVMHRQTQKKNTDTHNTIMTTHLMVIFLIGICLSFPLCKNVLHAKFLTVNIPAIFLFVQLRYTFQLICIVTHATWNRSHSCGQCNANAPPTVFTLYTF